MLGYRSLQALRAFVESGSVSQAALRLGRTQPQVGRLLASLEESLGFAIFVRHNRRLSLTEEGQRFYREVERVLVGHDELDRMATEIRRGRRDEHVRLLVAPTVTSALISDTLAVMSREVPEFTVSVESRERLDIETWVGREPFDLGISVLPLSHPAVNVEEFHQTEAVAVMHPKHRLARKDCVRLPDLLGEEVIATHPRSMIRQHLDRVFLAGGQTPSIRFEASSGNTACQLAAQGLGIALADPFVAMSNGAGIALRRFQPSIRLPYAFLYPAWRTRPPTVTRLAALIAAATQAQHERLAQRLG
jgi:DNA-binding transcriptional LysR family regulator